MRRIAFAVAMGLVTFNAFAQTDESAAVRAESWLRQLAPLAWPIAPQTHECSFHANLSCNSTVSDAVNIYGCRTDNFGYFNMHRFFVDTTTKITLSMQSFSYAPLVVLTNDAATSILASANASAGSTATLNYTTLAAGYYVALVGPVADLVIGSYTLTMTCTKASSGSCSASSTTLCLNGGRFAVSVAWKDFDNHTGSGQTIPLTNDTGAFWFFGNQNYELMLKVLDARTLNNRFWVFYGALSTVEYTMTVRDTVTGRIKTYFNKSGNLGSIADTDAFPP